MKLSGMSCISEANHVGIAKPGCGIECRTYWLIDTRPLQTRFQNTAPSTLAFHLLASVISGDSTELVPRLHDWRFLLFGSKCLTLVHLINLGLSTRAANMQSVIQVTSLRIACGSCGLTNEDR